MACCTTIIAARPSFSVPRMDFSHPTGQWRGARRIWGGPAPVGVVLYMAALVATRRNPVIHDFYQRLLVRGKCKKAALTACMRKLLTILNAIVKSKTPWCAEVAQRA